MIAQRSGMAQRRVALARGRRRAPRTSQLRTGRNHARPTSVLSTPADRMKHDERDGVDERRASTSDVRRAPASGSTNHSRRKTSSAPTKPATICGDRDAAADGARAATGQARPASRRDALRGRERGASWVPAPICATVLLRKRRSRRSDCEVRHSSSARGGTRVLQPRAGVLEAPLHVSGAAGHVGRQRAAARRRATRRLRYQPAEPTPATTALVQSMTAVGLTTWRARPSSFGSRPKARPTSWGRCRTGRPRSRPASALGQRLLQIEVQVAQRARRDEAVGLGVDRVADVAAGLLERGLLVHRDDREAAALVLAGVLDHRAAERLDEHVQVAVARVLVVDAQPVGRADDVAAVERADLQVLQRALDRGCGPRRGRCPRRAARAGSC